MSKANRIVVVTGMSGAGRSSCLKQLEDLGFEAVDNLPMSLLTRLLTPIVPLDHDLAIGMDSRTRGLEPAELIREVEQIRARGGLDARLVFMECDDDTLQRRYTETRRRHPLAIDRPIADGIALERALMAPLKAAADLVFDSTTTTIVDLRQWVERNFATGSGRKLTIHVVSFGFRAGLPREADIVFDVRFLQNPHYVDRLRPKTGLDADVQAYVRDDPDLAPTLSKLEGLVIPLLPRYRTEGKSYLTIAIGCTGGKHRSVYVAELLAERIRAAGWEADTVHRDIPMSVPFEMKAPRA